MKGILIGAIHKKGRFVPEGETEPRDYDNLILLLQKPMENENKEDRLVEGVGLMVVEAKCPWSEFFNIFGGKISTLEELEGIVGCEVRYFFNDKKKLDEVIF